MMPICFRRFTCGTSVFYKVSSYTAILYSEKAPLGGGGTISEQGPAHIQQVPFSNLFKQRAAQ